MSYDIRLVDPVTREPLHLNSEHDIQGGTYCLGGTTECWLNVTYNYARHFRRVLGEEGIRSIYGMSGADSIPVLRDAMEALEGEPDSDYWAPTEGNARKALAGLVELAQLRPEGVWEGD